MFQHSSLTDISGSPHHSLGPATRVKETQRMIKPVRSISEVHLKLSDLAIKVNVEP